MLISEKNETALKIRWKKNHYERYMQLKEKEITGCRIFTCGTGEKVISVIHNNREWRLNSIYEPEKAADLYGKRYEQLRDFAPVCFFGISDGRAVRAFLKNCNETQNVIIYEPNIETFLIAMREFELTEIINNENVYIVVEGINATELDKQLEKIVMNENRELMMQCILPNYDIIYREKCEGYIEKMLYYSKLESFKKNTEVQFGARMGDNILCNLPHLLCGYSVKDLKNAFLKLEKGETPAIIVSAGPSLDKNIKELKKAEGKAFIIGVDSALKALVREGIQFQIAVSVDPRKNPDVFEDERVNDFPYILANHSLPLIAEKNKKQLFFEDGYGFDSFEKLIKKHTGKELGSLRTGGSVATDALSLAFDLGFRNVILIGQDLAFTDGKGHVSGFEKSGEADKAHVAGRKLTEVEAYNGGTVMTDIQMNSYLQWFEIEIEKHKDETKVYDATEGGAKIHGTEELTLSEAISRFCKDEVDFNKIIQEIPPMFTEKEQQVLTQELLKFSTYIVELEGKLEKGIYAYQKLIEFEKAGIQQSKEYREVLRDIEEVNNIEEHSSYMSVIRLYSMEEEYDSSEDIYVADNLTIEEIASRGMCLLSGYVQGCRRCRTQAEKLLIPRIKGN